MKEKKVIKQQELEKDCLRSSDQTIPDVEVLLRYKQMKYQTLMNSLLTIEACVCALAIPVWSVESIEYPVVAAMPFPSHLWIFHESCCYTPGLMSSLAAPCWHEKKSCFVAMFAYSEILWDVI
jgi:hypothetical protein